MEVINLPDALKAYNNEAFYARITLFFFFDIFWNLQKV